MLQRLLFVPRVLAITVVLVFAHMIAAAGAGFVSSAPEDSAIDRQVEPENKTLAEDDPDTADLGGADVAASLKLLGMVVGMCVLEALAICMLLTMASAHGGKLMAGLAAAIFGVMTLQAQIEGVAFGVFQISFAARIGMMGLGIALIVSPLSVLLFWRVRATPGAGALTTAGDPGASRGHEHRKVPPWAALLIGGAIYVILYTVFGYFIAWQSPDVRAYYGGETSRGFLWHLWDLQLRVPWFIPFQFLRGCLWTVLAMLIMSLISGRWLRSGLVVGLFFAVMMNAQLLLPNPLMPEAVRLIHIAETVPSNFILGLVLAWLIHARGTERRGESIVEVKIVLQD